MQCAVQSISCEELMVKCEEEQAMQVARVNESVLEVNLLQPKESARLGERSVRAHLPNLGCWATREGYRGNSFQMDDIGISGKSMNVEDTERGNHGLQSHGDRFHKLGKSGRNAVRF